MLTLTSCGVCNLWPKSQWQAEVPGDYGEFEFSTDARPFCWHGLEPEKCMSGAGLSIHQVSMLMMLLCLYIDVYCLSSVVSSLTLRSDLCDTWGWGRRRQTRQALGSSSSLIELIWCFRSLAVLAASICIRTQISAHRRYRHVSICQYVLTGSTKFDASPIFSRHF